MIKRFPLFAIGLLALSGSPALAQPAGGQSPVAAADALVTQMTIAAARFRGQLESDWAAIGELVKERDAGKAALAAMTKERDAAKAALADMTKARDDAKASTSSFSSDPPPALPNDPGILKPPGAP